MQYQFDSIPIKSQLMNRKTNMLCIKATIPQEICDIDDELKAIYHSKETVCIWVFKTRNDRNRFVDETAGMLKDEREQYYLLNFND